MVFSSIKRINRLIIKAMSNIYLKVTIKKNCHSQNLSFLRSGSKIVCGFSKILSLKGIMMLSQRVNAACWTNFNKSEKFEKNFFETFFHINWWEKLEWRDFILVQQKAIFIVKFYRSWMLILVFQCIYFDLCLRAIALKKTPGWDHQSFGFFPLCNMS